MTPAPLFLLPGLLCDASVFAPQTAAFDGAIALDGYGAARSLVEMAAVVLAQAPARISLLGHSMGARVALEVYRLAPGRVERLALLSTGVHPLKPGETEKRHALRDLGRREGMAALVDAWLPPMVAEARQDDEALMAPLHAMSIRAGIATYEAQIAALLGRPEVEALLPAIACPVMVGVGRQDRWSPVDQHEAMAAAIPGATLTIFEDSGHMSVVEAPEQVNAAIRLWLDRN